MTSVLGEARAVTDWKGAESWTSHVEASPCRPYIEKRGDLARVGKQDCVSVCDHSTGVSHP